MCALDFGDSFISASNFTHNKSDGEKYRVKRQQIISSLFCTQQQRTLNYREQNKIYSVK